MIQTIRMQEKILGKNEELARENRRRFEGNGVYVVTLVGSPGSGKTSLLERTIAHLKPHLRSGVIGGDVETDRDAQRLGGLGVPVVQIVTGGTCHLNAGMVQRVLDRLDLAALDVLFIENVGNLVCPATYFLGEHDRVVVMSVTEGEDKPLKYPAMFRQASAVVINKTDLLPYVPASLAEARQFAVRVNPSLEIFETSCTTGAGIAVWGNWLRERWRSVRRAG
jgi:hydrogenase nickel incorporation protein HypB